MIIALESQAFVFVILDYSTYLMEDKVQLGTLWDIEYTLNL